MRNMAIVQYSSLVNKIIGKVGGSVFQKMGQSLGIREHRSFRPSGSVKACASRIALVSLGSVWGSLALAQQQSWGTAAASYTFYNRYGAAIILNGWQLFLYINKVRLVAGIALNPIPQNYFALTPPITADSPFSNYSGYWSPIMNPANTATTVTLFYISPIQSAVQVLTNQKWYFLFLMSTTDSFPPNLYSYCLSIWNRKPVATERFWYKVRRFDLSKNQWVGSNVSQVTVAN